MGSDRALGAGETPGKPAGGREGVMVSDPSIEELRGAFTEWMVSEAERAGLSEEVLNAYEVANPPGMSADGLMRYWKKVRHGG